MFTNKSLRDTIPNVPIIANRIQTVSRTFQLQSIADSFFYSRKHDNFPSLYYVYLCIEKPQRFYIVVNLDCCGNFAPDAIQLNCRVHNKSTDTNTHTHKKLSGLRFSIHYCNILVHLVAKVLLLLFILYGEYKYV